MEDKVEKLEYNKNGIRILKPTKNKIKIDSNSVVIGIDPSTHLGIYIWNSRKVILSTIHNFDKFEETIDYLLHKLSNNCFSNIVLFYEAPNFEEQVLEIINRCKSRHKIEKSKFIIKSVEPSVWRSWTRRQLYKHNIRDKLNSMNHKKKSKNLSMCLVTHHYNIEVFEDDNRADAICIGEWGRLVHCEE